MNTHPTRSTPGRATRGFRAAATHLCSSLTVALLATAASAQVAKLDQTTLIDALAEEGMSELLLHLIETEPPSDPVVAAQIEIAQYRLRYADPNLSPEEKTENFRRALDRTRQLIADLNDHEQRPIWQTDLAEMLIIDWLAGIHQSAAEFYEFGVPTPEQKRAFEETAVELVELMASANLRFYQLQTSLPREPDHVEKRVNTGLWARMIEEYKDKRTLFFYAHACHYASLLPDDHPYFTQPNPNIPGKQPTAAAEKKRLALEAIQSLERFVNDLADSSGVRIPSMTLTGRAHLVLGEPEAAAQMLQTVANNKTGDLQDLVSNLGVARALEARKQYPDALDKLVALEQHPLVQGNLLYRLLVVDASHRILMAQAQSAPPAHKAAAVTAAFEPYLLLLEDASLGEAGQALSGFIYRRWAASAGDQDISSLPPMVRMAIAEVARIDGQNLAVDARQNGDEAKLEEAKAMLQRAIEIGNSLTSGDVPNAVRARGMFNVGVAQFFLDPEGLQNRIQTTDTFVKLADEMPDQPQAEEAIAYAVQLLHEAHEQVRPRPAQIDEAYRRAVAVLFEKFPTTAAADNERLYYGYSVLAASGAYQDAIRILGGVPETHPSYFEAQREALFAIEAIMENAKGKDRQDRLRELRDRAKQLQEAAKPLAEEDESARRALAGVRLVLANAAIAERKIEEALKHLEGFEDDYDGSTDLIRIALGRRIVALAQANRLNQLETTAREMMSSYPDDAAYVIDRVLTQLDTQIDALRVEATTAASQIRQQEATQEASSLSNTAARLSGLLLQWAQDQNLPPDEMLPFRLIRAKSLRLAGDARGATEITSQLVREFPDDAEVLSQHAEALFAIGDPNTMVEAAAYFDKLIAGLPEPYPPMYWNAWVRRLQIMDRLDQNVVDIPLRVRVLKMKDPTLGGPRYAQELERLANEHAQ